MLGSIIGDIVGSVFEHNNVKSKNFSFQGSVPQAIICALEATDFEDAIRNAI